MHLFNRKKTFRPIKSHHQGTKRYELHKYAKATLGSGDMHLAVLLPKNEQLHEWLATNTVDFFNEISLVYGAISEFCTPTTCPTMSAGSKFEYLWKDGKEYKTPVKKAAPEYIDLLMRWVDDQLSNVQVFPVEGNAYPRGFIGILKNIYRRLFRVYAHLYYSHFEKVVNIGAEAHLNTCFKHFIVFVREFDLVERRELEPLKDLIDRLGSSSEKK